MEPEDYVAQQTFIPEQFGTQFENDLTLGNAKNENVRYSNFKSGEVTCSRFLNFYWHVLVQIGDITRCVTFLGTGISFSNYLPSSPSSQHRSYDRNKK